MPMNAIHFCGQREILYNLGKAYIEAEFVAYDTQNADQATIIEDKHFWQSEKSYHQGAMMAYQDAATQDNAFSQFVQDYQQNLQLPTKAYTAWNEPDTLLTLANSPSSLVLRAKTYLEFAEGLSANMIDNGIRIGKAYQDFMKALKPQIKPEDFQAKEGQQLPSAEEIEQFVKLLA